MSWSSLKLVVNPKFVVIQLIFFLGTDHTDPNVILAVGM